MCLSDTHRTFNSQQVMEEKKPNEVHLEKIANKSTNDLFNSPRPHWAGVRKYLQRTAPPPPPVNDPRCVVLNKRLIHLAKSCSRQGVQGGPFQIKTLGPGVAGCSDD